MAVSSRDGVFSHVFIGAADVDAFHAAGLANGGSDEGAPSNEPTG